MHALTNLPTQLAVRKCQVAEMFSKQVAKQISLITLSQVNRQGREGRGGEGRGGKGRGEWKQNEGEVQPGGRIPCNLSQALRPHCTQLILYLFSPLLFSSPPILLVACPQRVAQQ